MRGAAQAAKTAYSFDAPLPAGTPGAAFGNGGACVTDLAHYNRLLGLPPPARPPAAALPAPHERAAGYSLFDVYAEAPAAGAAQGWAADGGGAGWADLLGAPAPQAALLAAAAVATDGAPAPHAQAASEQDSELNELMAALMCQ